MIVLLEGIDGSGKTILCSELKEKGFEEIIVDRKTKNPYNEWKQYLNKNSLLVSDRSFITELVYRLQDDINVSSISLKQMCEILEGNIKIVYCKTLTSFTDSIKRGEDNITNKSQSDLLSVIYDYVMLTIKKFIGTKIFEYNWQIQNVDDVIKFINGGSYGIR